MAFEARLQEKFGEAADCRTLCGEQNRLPGSPGADSDALGAGAKAFSIDDDLGMGAAAELAPGVTLARLRELLKTSPHIGYMLHQGIADRDMHGEG